MSVDTAPTWFTVTEAAERLGVHKQTIYRLIYAGLLGWNNISTGKRPRIRISLDSLKAFAKSTERAA